MTSTTSKSSITAVKTTETIAEEPEEAPKTNGDSEGMYFNQTKKPDLYLE